MSRYSLLLVGIALAAAACGNTAITEPVVVNTGTARSSDGYEAALATVEAGNYPIVIKDPKNAFIRVRASSWTRQDAPTAVCFDMKAWHGSVDVHVSVPPGLELGDAQLSQLRAERKDLAWAISTRARLIAGEPMGPSASPTVGEVLPPSAQFPARSTP
jgi:hypothetical protein